MARRRAAALPRSEPERSVDWRSVALALALAALTCAFFANATLHRQLNLVDDDEYVTSHPYVPDGLSAEGIAWAFGLHGYAANWFPLTWLSLMLDVEWLGPEVGGLKAVNVAYHGLATLLLFVALRLMTGQLWPSACVAALFGIHPLRAESVVWVAERKDVLSAALWMATLVAYALYARRPGAARYAVLLGAFALGLLAKGTAVTLPVVLGVLDFWPLQRWRGEGARTLRQLCVEKLPLLALSAGVAVLTLIAQARGEAVRALESYGLAQRLANALESLTAYLGMWLLPTRLALHYPHRYPTPDHLDTLAEWGPALLSLLALGAISAAALALRRRAPALLAGWLWYGIALAPVLGLVQVGNQAMADRYTYIPSVGLAIAVVFPLWERLRGAPRLPRAVALGTLVGLLLGYGALTIATVRLWSDNARLYAHALEAAAARGLPDDGWMRLSLASAHLERARSADGLRRRDPALPARAVEGASQAAALRPGDPAAHQTLADALLLAGRSEEARRAGERALELASARGRAEEIARAHYALGLAWLQSGRADEARQAFERALRADPDFARAGDAQRFLAAGG